MEKGATRFLDEKWRIEQELILPAFCMQVESHPRPGRQLLIMSVSAVKDRDR